MGVCVLAAVPSPLGRNFQLATPGMTRVFSEAWAP